LKLVHQNGAIFDPVGNFELSDEISNYLLTRNYVLASDDDHFIFIPTAQAARVCTQIH
jgi:hypothetical protein